MDINIFSSGGKSHRTAVIRHLLTLLTAIILNLAFWILQGGDLEVDSIDILSTVLETMIVMEVSFAISRLVIRIFWRVEYSFASLLIQNMLLLAGVILVSAAISVAYSFLYPEAWDLPLEAFMCDSLIAYFLNSVFFTSFLTNKYREEKFLAQQVEIDKLKLKTDNHFVFNSLATLGTLIQSDPESAQEFNTSMSRIYRYIVSKGDSSLVSLREELDFIIEYKKNLSVRHSEISIEIDRKLFSLDSFIPPLTLQGLVENALKHNRHGFDNPLYVRIGLSDDDIAIIVTNNRQEGFV